MKKKKQRQNVHTGANENSQPTIYVNPFHGDVVTGGEYKRGGEKASM